MDEQPEEGEVERFWTLARRQGRLENMPGYFGPSAIGSVVPPTWSFGDDAEADHLVELVLTGAKTAMTHARADLSDDDLPTRGMLSILLDGSGSPRALLVTTGSETVAFDDVDERHAHAEGEPDLETWRTSNERFLREQDPTGRGFGPDMPVVLEQFAVLHPARRSAMDLALGR